MGEPKNNLLSIFSKILLEQKVYTDFDGAWNYKLDNNRWFTRRKSNPDGRWVDIMHLPAAIKKLNAKYGTTVKTKPSPVKPLTPDYIKEPDVKADQTNVPRQPEPKYKFKKETQPSEPQPETKKPVPGTSPDGQTWWDKFKKGAEGGFASLFGGVKEDSPDVVSATYLVFNGKQLYMTNGKTPLKGWSAIAGVTPWNTGKLINRNTKEYQTNKLEGPPPEGNYMAGAIQTRDQKTDPGVFEVIKTGFAFTQGKKLDDNWGSQTNASSIAWGNHRISIQPTQGTNTFGRGGFYIHGGNIPGSHGCIDLTDQMDDFTKHYAAWQAKNGKTSIPLVIKYA